MSRTVEKVTAFITRPATGAGEILLLRHPHAGIQIPAGTVKEGEEPAEAVMREAFEETGLTELTIITYLGERQEAMTSDQAIVAQKSKVYSRPSCSGFDWAYLPPGMTVTVNRRQPGYVQITYSEPDQFPGATYTTYQIVGWVPAGVLASVKRRHFFQLCCQHCVRS